MPKLVLGMQMCLRLSELNHPFWEEGGGERGKKKKYDTEGTLGECEMRVCCPSSRALPAAELAHGQAVGNASVWHPGGIQPGLWVLWALTSIAAEKWAEGCHPTITVASCPQPLVPSSHQPGYGV